ncbi:6-O-methylguanine DNA methyltransferase [Malaciobacter molluscorum LMG 25693]|uniref:methylated-DNA--[protein]-cysteine S-methyltransferase n=1 Tax=Malaciobacter molluscorum LMG 25693 TaxID=870501 RepID=A0A2G1DH77_9BACT|nr:methylated-DNA--[protein]-cysteine S-methyltransferase [Malaciobacter molluscorum]AXX91075.1 O6-methylguanine-DNA methyltransferase [Malaciobacter molluscorum LMG 25693]PHO17852.1 6-O-methylguanine DNA methyltransferase [Malaciobacter molluscorum LMG 25693]
MSKNKLYLQNENYNKIVKAIKYIDENFKEQPSIDIIAQHIGMSKYHFIRVFKEYVGVTPIQFLQSVTLNYAKEHLKESSSLLESSLDLGLSSPSRLHDLFVNIIGVTPKEYKDLGQNVEITYGYGYTPFGNALIATTKRGICFLGFYDKEKDSVYDRFKQIWANAKLIKDNERASSMLDSIFIKKDKKFNLYVKGTNFQINVWKALINIPDGSITTYQDVAKYLDNPKAVRAVANAIGSNPIGYLIPCHRVLGKSGAMTGYRWGIERKKVLVAYEAIKNNTKKEV